MVPDKRVTIESERHYGRTPLRLAIFTSHPIQYQAPWFRALAQVSELELKVFFSYIPDAKQQGSGFGKAFEWDVPLLEEYCWEALQGIDPPAWSPSILKSTVRGLAKAIRTYKPDVALVLGWHHMSLIQAVFTCRMMHIPIVLRGESNGLRRRPFHKRALHRCLFAQCTAFLAIGSKNADLYKSAGVSSDKIVTAPYFVDNEWFLQQDKIYRPSRDAIRRAFGILPNSICFCFVGKLEPKKRILDFISAFRIAYAKRLDISALIVGTGLLENVAKTEVERTNIPVAFAGFLNQSEISRAYVAADVIVLPSDYGETWGLVVNEAMVSGCPAVVSDRVGCAYDLVLDGQTGFVFPFGDVKKFAQRMLDLAENRDELRAMGQRAKAHVLAQFSMAEAVEETLQAVSAAAQFRSRSTS